MSSRDAAIHSLISGCSAQHFRLANSTRYMRSQSSGTVGGTIGVQMRFFDSSSVNVDSTKPISAALNAG